MSTFRLVHIGAAAALSIAGVTSIGVIQSIAAPNLGTASSFVPIAQCRLLDTRAGSDNVGDRSGPIGADQTIVVDVHGTNGNCVIPTTATAISANVTGVNPTAASFLTLYAADVAPRPTVSSLNWLASSPPTPNGVTVRLSAVGSIAAYNLAGSVDIIIDVVGFFEPTTAGSVGATGPIGSAGPTGSPGSAGPTGSPGSPGSAGTVGSPGGDGVDGVDGVNGSVGQTGTTGASGPQFGRLLALSSIVDTTGNVGLNNSITIGIDGNPVIAYREATAGNLRMATCNDPLCTNNDEFVMTLDSANDVGSFASITISADTFAVISYYDVTTADLKVVKCFDRTCSGGTQTVSTVDTIGNVGSFTSLAIGADGLPVISYYDTTNSSLKVAKCNDPACSGNDETLTTVDNSADVGQSSSIAIGPDTFPVISYSDVTSTALKVAKCSDAACAGAVTISTVDSPGVGASSTIAIGVDGFPVIAYQDSTNLHLKMAKCANSACTGLSQISVVDGSVGAGDSPSIVIGADGNPRLSYGAGTDVRLAECNDPACAGANETITTLATGSGVGASTSITLGRDASPVIAYRDVTNQELKVVKVSHTAWSKNGSGH